MEQPGLDGREIAPLRWLLVKAPDPNPNCETLAGRERRERPGHEHRLIGLDSARPVTELTIRSVGLNFVASLTPSTGCGRDDPGQPGPSLAYAKRIAVVLEADGGDSDVRKHFARRPSVLRPHSSFLC